MDDEDLRPWWARALDTIRPRPYALTRFVLLRLLGVVYVFAFLGLVLQGPALLGSHGLTPVAHLVELSGVSFIEVPSLFVLDSSDATLTIAAYAGLVLALALALGYANLPSLLALWFLYGSYERVGQMWFSFGWEIQLLETTLLAACLVHPWDPRPLRAPAPATPAIVLMRWLVFRIMLGAGLIKLRGSACWTELTCLDAHFETQPIPNPLSALFHHAPHWLHATGVVFNHVVELVLPWCVFGPRRLRLVAAAGMIAFQLVLIASGNLAFLNWLTLVPMIALLDDDALLRMMPRRVRAWLAARIPTPRDRLSAPRRGAARSGTAGPCDRLSAPRRGAARSGTAGPCDRLSAPRRGAARSGTAGPCDRLSAPRRGAARSGTAGPCDRPLRPFWLALGLGVPIVLVGALASVLVGLAAALVVLVALRPDRHLVALGLFAALVTVKSCNVVSNLASDDQRMNSHYDRLALVNTYGAFGSVDFERHELVIEGTRDPDPAHATWRAYELPCKPGELARRPCILGPYHLRLDWLIWFAAMVPPDATAWRGGEPARSLWLLHVAWKLLDGDRGIRGLFGVDPFAGAPPTFVRIRRFAYHLAPLGADAWWTRDHEELWLPPVSRDSEGVIDLLARYDWPSDTLR